MQAGALSPQPPAPTDSSAGDKKNIARRHHMSTRASSQVVRNGTGLASSELCSIKSYAINSLMIGAASDRLVPSGLTRSDTTDRGNVHLPKTKR